MSYSIDVGPASVGFQGLAQAPLPADVSAFQFFSGPQFFIALTAGILMAFAFQVLLTNFAVAANISSGINPLETGTKSWGKAIRNIESKVGGLMLFTVNTALFIACFLAVKLTLIRDIELGAIVAVVIWSAYFLLLLWTGSQAIGSMAGAVGSTASAGLQGVTGVVATALSGRVANEQIVNTVEASVAAVTRELQTGLAPDRLREGVQDYVKKLQVPQPDLKGISSQFLELLGQSGEAAGGESLLQTIKSAMPEDWSAVLPGLVQAATPEELKSGELSDRISQLLQQVQSTQGAVQGGSGSSFLQPVIGTLISTLAQRVDLSDLDLEQIAGQWTDLGQQLSQKAGQVAETAGGKQAFSILRTDVENYLLKSPSWYLQPENLDQGFRAVLFDPEAEPELVQQQLRQLNRRYFVEVLNRREGFSGDRVNDVVDQLELIRREVLDQVGQAVEEVRSHALRQRVETYLSSAPKESLNPEQIAQDFAGLLVDPQASYEILGSRLLQFDRDALRQMLLSGRQDLGEDEIEPILNELEGTRDRFLNQSQEQWSQIQAQAGEFRGQVESYLRETNPEELTPAGLRQMLQTLANAPEMGGLLAQTGLGQLDRGSLEQVLAQRDLNPDQVHHLLDQIESVRDDLIHAPQALAGEVKDQYEQIVNQLGDYLRGTNLSELTPEAISQQLGEFLNHPQASTLALRQQLAQIDRDTLVNALSQRSDLNPAEVNQVIDQAQSALRSLVRSPQRLASRTRDRIDDFQSTLADYLRHTQRQELNPEGIRRDLQLLLKQPQAGLSQWGDRLSQIDRGTLVALLAQRQDVSEEEANQIADQILGVGQQIQAQVQNAQKQAQSAVDGVFDRLRSYLNALEQPELNYDSVKRDMQTLFQDPEAGLVALRDRLGQFDRDTLTAILSSRSDISREQADRIIDQIEGARDSVLHQAERFQSQVEKRIEDLKEQAKEQAEEAQKTVATAAWWLFGTAITSVATAAIAGVLASGGFDVLS
ncbi:MAG: apolipoprotein A1/A4/E family protein [Cyanobacteria bacterium Co-bin13]|nr:apolipoprotein A1/A4/E family protein [Cyanobacteria bacterium Co-bin13]